MAAGVKSFSKTFVWIIVALLILGLAGFGATNLSGTIRTIGFAGDQAISVDAYGRELQREIRAFEAQTGQTLPMSQVRALGIDQTVLSRLVGLASLDDEVAKLGVSIGDENLQQEVLEIPAFQGIDGKFDRESYRFALSNSGLNETEFENDLRAGTSRTLVQGAIVAGTSMPEILTDVMTDYIASRRNFTWARMTAEDLDTPIAAPTGEELQAYYDANPDDFTLPETKRLAYVMMTPEMILDQVEIDETALRELYESRSDEYDVPERRLIERLAFADISAASSARAQLDVGGTTFEALVDQRGLALADVDLGDVTREALREAADEVFAAEIGDVVGPLPSALGPALYRVNGTLAARITTLEEAREELHAELAGDRARRMIENQAENLNDLMAGGATLEELADESDMELGTISWNADTHEGIAAYEEFRETAAAVTDEDFPEIGFTEDGAIFAIRLEEVLPVRPEPFAAARESVAAAWALGQTEAALRAQAETIVAELGETGDLKVSELSVRVENGMTRTAFVESTPPDFLVQVFEMTKGELRIIEGAGTVLIVRLDDTLPPEETEELAAMQTTFGDGLDQALSEALFQAYLRDAQLRAKPQIDQRALNAVHANFQ